MKGYDEEDMTTVPLVEIEKRKLYRFKWILFGAVVITYAVVTGYVGTVFILSKLITQQPVTNREQLYDENSGFRPPPKIYNFEDFTVALDLPRDLVIVKNITTGNCFVTKAQEVSFVGDHGEVDNGLRVTTVETGEDEFTESGTFALRYFRRDTIPREFLASTTSEDVKAMCMKTTFWANQSTSGSLETTGRHRQRRYCYWESYPCGYSTCYRKALRRLCSLTLHLELAHDPLLGQMAFGVATRSLQTLTETIPQYCLMTELIRENKALLKIVVTDFFVNDTSNTIDCN